MAEYTPNLNLFKPGTDDNMEIEGTLRQNFENIDSKLGDALKDLNQTIWNSLGQRLNDYQQRIDDLEDITTQINTKSVNVLFNEQYFRFISLRGHKGAPENSIIGYHYAIQNGFWGIWGDVQLTSDNYWVCFGDATLDAKTNGTGAVNTKTLSQIRALDLGQKFTVSGGAQWYSGGVQIPTIDEYLHLCVTNQVVPIINVVGTYNDIQMQNLHNKLNSWNLLTSCVVVSSVLSNLQNFRLYNTKTPVGLYMSTFSSSTLDSIVALGNSFAIYTDAICNASNVSTAKSKDLIVIAYLATDNNNTARSMISTGCRGLITRAVAATGGI